MQDLIARLIGDGTSYMKMMDTADRATVKLQKQVEKASRTVENMGKRVTKVGRTLTVGLTLPLIAMGTAAANEFAKFDQAMTQSTSIMGKMSDETTAKMRSVALNMEGAVQGPTALAKSYFFLASAGLDAEQSMAALPRVAEFATAGAFNMALATDLLTDAQSALGLTSKDAAKNMLGMARVSDVLVKANTLANASVQQFSESLTNTAGATLKNFNKSVEEGVAVLAAYADQGVKANVAGTNLTRVTLLLQKATLDNAKAHKRLGFSVFDSHGKMRNYADIIKNLEVITKGMSDKTKSATLAQLGFTARVQNAILPLIGASDKIRQYEADLRKAGGTTNEVAEKQMKSFTNQMLLMKNRVIAGAIALGERLAPSILMLNEKLLEAAGYFKQLSPEMQEFVAIGVVAAAALGPLLVVIGTLVSSLSHLGGVLGVVLKTVALLATPVGATVAIVLALGAALYAVVFHWEEVKKASVIALTMMVDMGMATFRTLARVMGVTLGWMQARWEQLWQIGLVNAIKKGLAKAVGLIKDFGKWVSETIRAAISGKSAANLKLDFSQEMQEGRSTDSLLKSLSNIGKEEFALFQSDRSSRFNTPTNPEPTAQMQPVETTPNSEQKSLTEKISTDISELVKVAKQQLNKPTLEVSAANLGSTARGR